MLDSHTILSVSEDYTRVAPKRQIGNVMLQLSSETGEMCDWINRPWRQKETFAGECADVINCVVDALFLHVKAENPDMSLEDVSQKTTDLLNTQIKVKCAKWRKAVNADV